MIHEPKPTPYYVLYSDPALYEQALREVEGESDLLDPTQYWVRKDFRTRSEAEAFARRADWPEGGQLYGRRSLHWTGYGWEYEDVCLDA